MKSRTVILGQGVLVNATLAAAQPNGDTQVKTIVGNMPGIVGKIVRLEAVVLGDA